MLAAASHGVEGHVARGFEQDRTRRVCRQLRSTGGTGRRVLRLSSAAKSSSTSGAASVTSRRASSGSRIRW